MFELLVLMVLFSFTKQSDLVSCIKVLYSEHKMLLLWPLITF